MNLRFVTLLEDAWDEIGKRDSAELQEICEEHIARIREDRLRVKLHPEDRILSMGERHDRAVTRPCCDLKTRGERCAFDDEGMIAAGGQWIGHAREQRSAFVKYLRRAAVHRLIGADDASAECLSDCLVPKAYAQDRNLCVELFDDRKRTARFIWRTWSGRKDNCFRLYIADGAEIDRIVSCDKGFLAQPLEIASEVENEAVVVVDEEDHFRETASDYKHRLGRFIPNCLPQGS
jgi:hypothetical protein